VVPPAADETAGSQDAPPAEIPADSKAKGRKKTKKVAV